MGWKDNAVPISPGMSLDPNAGGKKKSYTVTPEVNTKPMTQEDVLAVVQATGKEPTSWRDRASVVQDPVAPVAEIPQATPVAQPAMSTPNAAWQGIKQGATLGFGDELQAAIAAGTVGLNNLVTGDNSLPMGQAYDQALSDFRGLNKQAEQSPLAYYGGQLAGGLAGGLGASSALSRLGLASGGAATATGATGLPGALINIGKQGIKGATSGALGGAAYGFGTGEGIDNRISQAQDMGATGALFGGAVGAAIPALGALGGAVGSGISRAVTPTIAAEKQPIIDLAAKHGIRLGVDDLTDSQAYKTMISEGKNLPFSGAAKEQLGQQQDLNRAVSRTMGKEADSITPEYIAERYKTIGADFDSFTKGKKFNVSSEFYNDLENIVNDASVGKYGKDGKDFLQPNMKRIQDIIDEGGQIKGERLDKLRREFAELSRTRHDDIGRLAGDMEDSLVNIITSGDPKVAKQITDAKYKYKNLKTIQGIALKDQVNGDIRPALLTGAVRSKYGETALAKGEAGDLGEIARVAQSLKEPPNSGTAQRQFAQKLLTGNALAATPAYVLGGPVAIGAQVGAQALGTFANRALQRGNFSPQKIENALAKYQKQLAKQKSVVSIP